MKINFVICMVLFYIPVISQCPDNANVNYDYCLSEISIEGSTNLNNFSFWYENPLYAGLSLQDIECYLELDSGKMDFSIPVTAFKGSIPAMRNDFLNLLKASKYPEITVGIEKNEFDCIASGIVTDRIDMVITLAGRQKSIRTIFSASVDSGNRMILSGITEFLLTDFQLEPPEKALGLVRVQNEVFIKFDIVILNTQIYANQALD